MEYIIHMQIETKEEAMPFIEEYYKSIDQPTPKISDIQVLHSDSAVSTIRYHVHAEPASITQTIKIVGSNPPTLLQ
jgi:hypothetical protein